MKITDKTKEIKTPFYDVKDGEVFRHDGGKYYLKAFSASTDVKRNAVNLGTGALHHFGASVEVQVVNAELVVTP